MNNDYEFVFTCLYGSQNYNLDNENSDSDYKMAVVPTIEKIALEKTKYTKIHKTENGGQVEVKDIRNTFVAFKKMSLVDLEILFSKKAIVNKKYKEEFDRLTEIREELLKANPYRLYQVILGTMTSSLKKKYTPKKACQSIRYYDLFDRYLVKDESFKSALDASKSELYNFMKEVKAGEVEEEKARKEIEKMVANVESYKEKVPREINYKTYQKLDLILIDIFKKKFKEE